MTDIQRSNETFLSHRCSIEIILSRRERLITYKQAGARESARTFTHARIHILESSGPAYAYLYIAAYRLYLHMPI